MTLLLALAPACDRDDDDDLATETSSETGDDGDNVVTDDGGEIGHNETDNGDTAGLTGCAVFTSEDDCSFAPSCSPVYGNLLVDDGDGGWCAESPQEFIGCVSWNEMCPTQTRTLCDDDSMWRTDGCVPDNLTLCEPPGEFTGACSPSASQPG